jgi:hypothetical protein
VKSGGTLLSVHCDTSDQVTVAKRALEETGAKDVASSGEEGSRRSDASHQTETEYELKNT